MQTKNDTCALLTGISGSRVDSSNIQRIRIECLKDNPNNFYGLRDIEGLAHKIFVSNIVEPLVVEPIAGEDDKYMIIAGHRRKAAWQMLLDNNIVEEHTLPCVVCSFSEIQIGERTFSAQECANMYLMLSNMGQRTFRSIDEKLKEIEQFEPFARNLFESLSQEERSDYQSFRNFFATNFLDISSTKLQRLTVLKNLIPMVKEKIDSGELSVSFGAELASLPQEQQYAYMNSDEPNLVTNIIKFKQDLRAQKDAPEPEAEPQEEPDEKTYADDHPQFPDDDQPLDFAQEPQKSDVGITEPVEESDPVRDDSGESEGVIPKQDTPAETINQNVTCTIADVPARITDPQAEAKNWLVKQNLAYLTRLKDYAMYQARHYEETDELISSQWKVRASVLNVQIVMLQKKY